MKRPQSPPWTLLFLITYGLLCYLPLAYLFINSLKYEGQFSTYWYEQLFADTNLLEPTVRSLQIAFLNGLCSTLLGLITALALKSGKFPLTKKITNFFLGASLALPELVMALSLLSWFFVIGLKLSLITVIISHITFSLAFSVFIINARLAQMDPRLEEAAADLGASPLQITTKIILPQLTPASALSIFLCFLLSFDDFLITYFVSGIGSDTLPLRLYQVLKQGTSPKISALASLLIAFPLLTLAIVRIYPKFIGGRKNGE